MPRFSENLRTSLYKIENSKTFKNCEIFSAYYFSYVLWRAATIIWITFEVFSWCSKRAVIWRLDVTGFLDLVYKLVFSKLCKIIRSPKNMSELHDKYFGLFFFSWSKLNLILRLLWVDILGIFSRSVFSKLHRYILSPLISDG